MTDRDPDDAPTFDMDGMEHVRGDLACCSVDIEGGDSRRCSECGGRMHWQSCYGGYFHKCEDCGDTG